MGKNNYIRILACTGLLFLTITLSAQENRYIVYFPDKSDSQFTLFNPTDFLSQKAIDRREKHDIAISEEDFPVSKKYIDSLSKYDLKAFFTSRWFNCALIQTTEEKVNELEGKSFVSSIEYVAPNAKLAYQPEVFDGDYVPKSIGSITRTSSVQLNMLHANSMHKMGYTGEGLWIAVFDGGFLGADSSVVFKHLYDNNRIVDKLDFTAGGTNVFQYDDHGTNVLSCIGANLESTIVGTAYNANFSLYVTEEPKYENEYRVEEYNWLFAAERADSSGVDIITSSLGYNTFEDPSMDYSIDELDGKTSVITRAANLAFSKGILVVISAGNSGNDSSWQGKINFPADGENILTIGAVDEANEVAGFSSRGPTADGRIKPDLVARGVGTAVLHANGNVGFNNGTSFSTPLIAGFAAAVWQYSPNLTNIELLELLKSAGDTFSTPDNIRGYGLPTFSRITGNVLAIEKVLLDKVIVFPNPFVDNTIHIKMPNVINSKRIEFLVFNTKGKLIGKKRVNQPSANEVIDVSIKAKTTGLYFLTINSDNFSKKVKLIKY